MLLGSSGKQTKLLRAITRGLEDVAEVEPWTTTFNPGRSTLDRLVELSREVDSVRISAGCCVVVTVNNETEAGSRR